MAVMTLALGIGANVILFRSSTPSSSRNLPFAQLTGSARFWHAADALWGSVRLLSYLDFLELRDLT